MEFLHTLIAFLASNNVLPSEVTPSDKDREKTYLQNLPDNVDNACCVRLYDSLLPSLTDKQAGIHRIQVLVRNRRQSAAIAIIYDLWKFLINRPSLIEDISPVYWVIFDVTSGPIPLGQDEKGNYLYSLNFPVKTRMF